MHVDESLVQIKNLTKTFTPNLPPALKEINASFFQGKIAGLVGPDGSGKTTLIRLIAGLLLPSTGSIQVAGYDTVKDSEMIHALSGYMPQKFGLYEDLTVLQNLNLYADLRGVLGQERIQRFEKLLNFTGLFPFKSRLAKALSGGMKQKLGLACALIKKPTLLLLDEPSVGVDPVSRRELWSMMDQLLTEGISIVWSTAYLDEAEKCDTVIVLSEGKLIYSGPPEKMMKRVENRVFKVWGAKEKRRKLLSEILELDNVIDASIQGEELRVVITENSSLNIPQMDHLEIRSTPARFEDGFMDILGGGPGGKSLLATRMPQVSNHEGDIILAQGLTKKFGDFVAADHISFNIKRGEIFGLLGPNGAGKSTTFKMLCGLLKPTEGKAIVNKVDLQVAPGKARADIGYMAQKFSLYGGLSVLQNLDFFAGIYNLKKEEKKKSIDEMIEIFGFQPYINASAELLPLGFKQRLSLAAATMHRPKILFLDEPTSGVDPHTRREFWNHINGLVEKGVTIMVTTHFMDEAQYCDRIALIYGGKVIYMETPDALKELAKTEQNQNPTLEDAFVKIVEEHGKSR